jgi:hypothetical protein
MLDQNILSTATWPLLYTQNPSLIILVLSLVHPTATRLTARLVNDARDAVSIGKPRRCRWFLEPQLNNGAAFDPKPRRANRIWKLARYFARSFGLTSTNPDWFQRLASADLAPAAICQIKSEDVKKPEEKFAIATRAEGGSSSGWSFKGGLGADYVSDGQSCGTWRIISR